MMRPNLFLIAASMMIVRISSADAGGFWTGNELLRKCSAPEGSTDSFICGGYLMGILDAYGSVQVTCPPPHVELGQVREIVVKFLQSHPESRIIRHQAKLAAP
jgi:hypothetical protein